MFLAIVGSVFGAAALGGWAMHRGAKSADKAEQDPKYRRRLFYRGAALYGFGLVVGVSQVLSGNAPPATLFAAIVPLLFVWFFLRAAKRVKVPPPNQTERTSGTMRHFSDKSGASPAVVAVAQNPRLLTYSMRLPPRISTMNKTK